MKRPRQLLQLPGTTVPSSQLSAIMRAFAAPMVPVFEWTVTEEAEAMRVLGMTPKRCWCAYCGDPATHWDHLYAVVEDDVPTGYATEIENLVPACGTCSRSKKGAPWREWINGAAARCPGKRRPEGLEVRIAALEAFEDWGDPRPRPLRGSARQREELWSVAAEVGELLKTADDLAAQFEPNGADRTPMSSSEDIGPLLDLDPQDASGDFDPSGAEMEEYDDYMGLAGDD